MLSAAEYKTVVRALEMHHGTAQEIDFYERLAAKASRREAIIRVKDPCQGCDRVELLANLTSIIERE